MKNQKSQKTSITDLVVEERSWAIYARSAVTNPLEIQRQLTMCLDLGVSQFKEDPFVYFDDGQSGMFDNRAEFQSLMRSVAAGHFKAVVVSNLDRISRNFSCLVQVIDHFETHDTLLFTIGTNGRLTEVDRIAANKAGITTRRRTPKQLATAR
jgi:DNA invertase Pin-like site-specific DNA recombinase